MAAVKTTNTGMSAETFIASVEPQTRRKDAQVLDALFRRVTGMAPKMWGPSIIGYGTYDYTYDSGHSGTSLRAGFSPRKSKHSLYLNGGQFTPQDRERRAELLGRLGKHGEGKECIYVDKLADIDLAVLEELIRQGWDSMARAYPQAG